VSYTPPTGDNVVLIFKPNYTAPAGSNVVLLFGAQDNTLFPGSFDGAAFGVAKITLQLRPGGFDAAAFGTAALAIGAQTAHPSGWDASAFGTATVYQRVRCTGFDASAFGTLTIYNLRQYITPSGLDGKAFGTQSVANHTRYITPTGLDGKAFGTTVVSAFTRYLTPTGPDFQAYGATRVEHKNRTVTGIGYVGAAFGTATIRNQNRSLFTPGFSGAAIGVPHIDYKLHLVYPDTLDGGNFAPRYIVHFTDAQIVYGDDSNVDGAQFGSHFVARVRNPAGLGDMQAFGTARVENFIRYLLPTGFSGAAFGVQWVSNWIRYVTPGGFVASKFGDQWVSNWIRYITPAGLDDSVVWNDYGPITPIGPAAAVRHRLRVTGAGYDGAAFGSASAGLARRYVAPAGFDGLQLGDLAAAKINVIHASGIDGALFGDIDNWEAGKAKVYGADLSQFGIARIDRVVHAGLGDAGAFGALNVAQRIRASGFDGAALNSKPALVNEVGCHESVIAFPAVGDGAAFGTASVHT
jgi:hypothetical protein